MRFYKILFSLTLFFLFSCSRDKAPADLIEEDRFIPLLVDIHLADGYLSSGPQIPDSLNYRGNGLYAAIFKKHRVDSSQFKKSFQYYSSHLEQMNLIYKTVVDQLKAKNDSIIKLQAAAEMKKNKHQADSLAKAVKIDSARQAAKRDSVKKTNAKKLQQKSIANHK